jgi:hypothetical protein
MPVAGYPAGAALRASVKHQDAGLGSQPVALIEIGVRPGRSCAAASFELSANPRTDWPLGGSAMPSRRGLLALGYRHGYGVLAHRWHDL